MRAIARGVCILALAAPMAAPTHAAGVVSEKTLSLDLATAIAEGALATCRQNGWHVSITVLDRAAQIRVQLRDDGANLFTVENSYREAYTARNFNMPSKDFAKAAQTEPTRQAQATLPGVIALGGGLPIHSGDEIIGAVGVSGSPGKDDLCAQGGIDKVAEELK